jgi:hypothetical protein
MAEKFEDRFKGKTNKMDRTGLNGLAQKGQTPVTKDVAGGNRDVEQSK